MSDKQEPRIVGNCPCCDAPLFIKIEMDSSGHSSGQNISPLRDAAWRNAVRAQLTDTVETLKYAALQDEQHEEISNL